MPYVPAKVSNIKKPEELRLNRIDGGVSYKYIETQLNDNQSPYMENVNADDRGGLTKFKGQKAIRIFGSQPINGIAYFKGKYVVACGTELYELEPSELE